MSYPRAVFPDDAVAFYRQHGAVRTREAYRCHWSTFRRWLLERGEPIRPQGLCLGRQPAKAAP